jgi:DNA polymerase-2
MPIKGFILTRQRRDTGDACELEIWLSSDQGPVRLIVPDQYPVFFFRAADIEPVKIILQQFLTAKYKFVNLKNNNNEAIMALYCSGERQLRSIVKLFSEKNISCWESDIKLTDRFLMERFVTSSLICESTNSSPAKSFQTLRSTKITPCYYQPDFTVISLDIETSMDATNLYSIAVYNENNSIVFMVDETYRSPESKNIKTDAGIDLTLIVCPSESYCLQQFLKYFSSIDPDIIIGWHVVQFDLWILEKICQKNNINFLLGRAGQKISWQEDSQHEGRHYAQVPGRIVLDGIELLRTAFYNFERFSLQFVANELLGESKLLNEDTRGKDIGDLFLTNKLELAAYNLQDCKLVWAIFEKTNLLDFAIERARLTGLPMDRVGGSVASFDYAYLPRLHRSGYIAPNLGDLESEIISPGGYVMNSKPGLYRHVLVLDFKSLYPSIIRTFKIDPYAYWVAQHQELTSEAVVEGFNQAKFSIRDNILPGIIDELWMSRDDAKANNNKPLSQAIKIIMNSFYGVLGSTGCRFYDPRVCSSITLRGHEILQRTRDWIISQGYDVIYGDTDSVFVWLDNDGYNIDDRSVDDSKAQKIGKYLASGLNVWWQENIRQEHSVESHLEIEFETHYSIFLMPTIRGSNIGSKKRYAGIIKNIKDIDGKKIENEELVFKGLEAVRTDWTNLAKEFQRVLYLMIFKSQPYNEYICRTVKELLAGQYDEQLIYKKKLKRKLNEYKKSTPPHVKAARKLYELTGELLGRGDTIYYIITTNGPEPISHKLHAIDYQHYIDKQLKPIADSILNFVDDSFERIANQQLILL